MHSVVTPCKLECIICGSVREERIQFIILSFIGCSVIPVKVECICLNVGGHCTWNCCGTVVTPSCSHLSSQFHPLCARMSVCVCVCVFAGMCMCAGNIIFYSYLIFYVLYTLYIYTGHDLVKCSVQLDTALQK